MSTLTSTQKSELSFTLRNPPYTYFHLSVKHLVPQPGGSSMKSQTFVALDEITARQYLNAALQQYLGLFGSAFSIDILKVENEDIWIRVPYEDGNATAAAISQWSSIGKALSLRIRKRGSWLGSLVAEERQSENLWTLNA